MLRPSASALLSLCIALGSSPAVLADCIIVEPHPISEVKIIGCEAPDARAREQYQARYDAIPDGGGGKIALEGFLREPARIVTLKRIRFRDEKPGAAWHPFAEKDGAPVTALVVGSADCKDFAAGTTKALAADDDCCDTGISSLKCLLGMTSYRLASSPP